MADRPSTEEFAAAICCHDDHYFLEASCRSFISAGIKVTAFISDIGWDRIAGDYQKCVAAAERAGAEIVMCSCATESEHRSLAVRMMKERAVQWLFVFDGDEIAERIMIINAMKLARTGLYGVIRCYMQTYWKSLRYRIMPPENLAPIILINCQEVEHKHIREYDGVNSAVPAATLSREHGILNHLSYCGPDERIKRKITSWGHASEVQSSWWENVWCKWEANRCTMTRLHPTHPECYDHAERFPVPEILKGIDDWLEALSEPPLPENYSPKSVIIPLFGGPDELLACLESIEKCGIVGWKRSEHVTVVSRGRGGKRVVKKDVVVEHADSRLPLFREVIVVDDCSPDNAPDVVKLFPFARLIRNEENLGFGGSTNVGIAASTGEQLLLCNSDLRLTRAGVIRMDESLNVSGTIAAVGPMSNNVGYEQAVPGLYSDIRNLERFACDFAHREGEDAEDKDATMVVGFCMLVRRSVLGEVGAFDTSLGKSLYEDTDLVTRLKIAGYKTVISRRAFVHHEGSRSLARTGIHPSILLANAKTKFYDKWRLNLETQHLSHLPGESAEPIRINPDREPKKVLKKLAADAKRAGISVCIIARDESKNIVNCIRSLRGVMPEVIVLDTGSLDDTPELAEAEGAEVYRMTWPDSFSVARNVSISYASAGTKFIFWIDADDVVPFATLEAVIQAALTAPPEINGFIVPVQFVEAIPGTGTLVDHVKLFRRDPRHQFEGRIHENILPSLRATGGQIGRIDHPVLHAGYDSSPAGQKKKRIRDRYLLALDLKDRPRHPFAIFNLGMTAFYSGRYRQAIGWLKRSLAVSDPGDSHVRKVFVLYAASLRATGRLEQGIAVLEQGLSMLEDPEIRYNLATSFMEQQRFAEARAHLLAINPDTSGFFSSIDIGIIGFRRFMLLATCCLALGHESEAKHFQREAIKANPRFSECAKGLYDIAVRTGDIMAAREAAEAMRVAEGPSETWAAMRGGIADMAGIGADAELGRLVNENPQAIGPGLVLARRILASGHWDRTVPLLQHLEMLGCAEAAFHLGRFELQRGHLAGAQHHTAISLQLRPEVAEANAQMVEIQLAIDDLEPTEPLGISGDEVLVGPHVGMLGPASKEHSVVVVTFNSAPTVADCLERVLRTIGPNDELIVVDNASTDDTLSIVQAISDPRMTVLPQPENHGYSKAVNIGMLASHGAKITALNPDAFVEDCWLERMSAQLTGDVAAVGPSSDMVAGQQFVGHYLGGIQAKPDELGALMAVHAGKPVPTKLLMGVCLMMRRDLLDQHGLLCEETDLGADDLEFSFRFQMLGKQLVIVPEVFVHHVGGASFATLPSLEVRRRIRRSDRALIRRLKAYYGDRPIPSSMEIWGCDIFAEALARGSR